MEPWSDVAFWLRSGCVSRFPLCSSDEIRARRKSSLPRKELTVFPSFRAMASAAIAPAAAPTAAAPQAHSSGSMPLAETTAAATKQASAPTVEHPLKRVADTHDGSNAGLSAKLPKHAGSSQTPDAPKGASFSNDVREHVRFAQLQQELDKLSTMDTVF